MDINEQDALFQQRRLELHDAVLQYGSVKQGMNELRERIEHDTLTNNPHNLTKHSIDLGNVKNHRFVTNEEIYPSPSNAFYSSPKSTQHQIDTTFSSFPYLNYQLTSNKEQLTSITLDSSKATQREIIVNGDTNINFIKGTNSAIYRLKVLYLEGNVTYTQSVTTERSDKTLQDFNQGPGLYYVEAIQLSSSEVTLSIYFLGELKNIANPKLLTYQHGGPSLGYIEELADPPFNVTELLNTLAPASQHINTNSNWFKVTEWGKVYYVAKEPMIANVTYEQFTSSLNQPLDDSYIIDGLYGDQDVQYPFTGDDKPETHNSQYNRLIYRLVTDRPTSQGSLTNWTSYNASELGFKTANGLMWCKSHLKGYQLVRGSDRASKGIGYGQLTKDNLVAAIRPVVRVQQRIKKV